MGALTSYSNKRDPFSNTPDFHISKKPRLSFMHQISNQTLGSSNSTVSRISRYPETKTTSKFRREVHAPCRILKFGLSRSKDIDSSEKNKSLGDDMGNFLSNKLDFAKRSAIGAFRYLVKEKQVTDVDNEFGRHEKEVLISEDSSIEEVEAIEADYGALDDNNNNNKDDNDVKIVEERSVVTNDGGLQNAGRMLESLVLNGEVDVSSLEAYKKLLENAERRNGRLQALDFEIEANQKRLSFYQSIRPVKKPEEEVQEIPKELFIPLTREEETEVKRAFSANYRRRVLTSHKNSNIDITGEILRCLAPGAWLNDEVINVYLELLKEREKREPEKFLKCHFFNTFFYKKLLSGDYKAVRRWTTERKLGYFLIDCDKIFVPVHREVHWCLAIINKKDQKFQYLDSLKGRDFKVLENLAKYYVEEVKDKCKKDIDVSNWELEFVEDLPEQQNGTAVLVKLQSD
ncbi:ubiquitin-like-specific protease ESD4 isoform X2 [Ricinus communis]|uniref:ubiquitin-like-specific protease ESD4 isoform X2 n=1 Tax=Ricinus communis TaxID=3988 RepID=UPI000772B2A8|nr:ubiquitin-like-specific protease ESD4 isoform X2 [Ricinus communis]|eukprot:XP_015573337.1 ubiquitin-like-specific protease ESD4 isoform X2 [Ricinus communis]